MQNPISKIVEKLKSVNDLKDFMAEKENIINQLNKIKEENNCFQLKASGSIYANVLEQNYCFKSLVECLHGLLWAKDLNGKYERVNKSFSNLVDFVKSEKLIESNDFDIWSTYLDHKYQNVEIKVLETDRSVNYKKNILHNGTERWFDTYKAPTYNNDVELIDSFRFSRDITLQKDNENKLLVLSTLMKQSSASVVITDLDGNIEYANDKYCLTSGFSLNEVLGKNPEISNPQKLNYDRYKDLWKTIISGGIWHGELETINKNGEKYMELASISPIKNTKGEITHLIGVNEDVTTRRIIEKELHGATQLQDVLIKMSSKYINLELSEIDAGINKLLCELCSIVEADRAIIFNYDWENEVCNNTYEYCKDGIDSHIDEQQNIGLSQMSEWIKLHIKGKILDIPDVQMSLGLTKQILDGKNIKSQISVPLMNNDICMGFLGFDYIHKYYRYSENEKSLLFGIGQMFVNLLQRSILEKALILEKEHAQKATKAKSEFVATMSHELRAPLNGVIGFSEILLQTNLSEVQQQYANAINTSANSLLGIINDILDYSKIEANRLELQVSKTDIVKLIEQSLDIVKFPAEKKKLELLLDIPQNLPKFAYVDSIRLTQILSNLSSNAVKFTTSGEIELKVTYENTENDLGKFSFYVRDTGIGISEEHKSKLFKAFSQADGSTSRKFGGTGLGLIISDKIAQKMGSEILFESEKGIGTTFQFSIETKVEHDTDFEFKPIESVKRILIIDDNQNSLNILEKMISSWGIECVTCESPFNAIMILQLAQPFDVIIMDNRMNNINGIEAVKLMCDKLNITTDNQIFILLQSMSEDYLFYDECNRVGIELLLTKPIKHKELYNCLDKLKYDYPHLTKKSNNFS